jgi:signal transduction histidine kinase
VCMLEFTRSTTFRWTLAVSGGFIVGILLMFGFILAQAHSMMTTDVDASNNEIANAIASHETEQRISGLDQYLRADPHHVKLGGLFAADGRRIAGNIETLPATLRVDAGAQFISMIKMTDGVSERHDVRAVARGLPGGGTLVIARSDYEFTWIVNIVERTLAVGIIPALCLSLAVGVFLSIRAQKRIGEINSKIQRIVAGELQERLPARGTSDTLDELAALVNGMLDEIEVLVCRLAGVGDDIAHDLRTPLTRVRVSLERARQKAGSLDELRRSVDQAMVGLDQSLATITALLRISEIEHSRRVDGFRNVPLADLVHEVGDLYKPIAEDKKLDFGVRAEANTMVHGDRDLLFEAIANLVDNAIKFTPQGGRVELSLLGQGNEAVVRVCDTGPGIPANESELVTRRFYRSDNGRREPGLGLGLTLVSAIAKLHGFNGPGCMAEIAGQREGVKCLERGTLAFTRQGMAWG